MIPVLFTTWLGIPLSLSLFLGVTFCMFNDVVNSLAMVSEKAEQDIMSRPPALRHKSHLVDWKLLVHAYLIVGNIECFAAYFCFFWYYSAQGKYWFFKKTRGDHSFLKYRYSFKQYFLHIRELRGKSSN